MTVRSTNNTRGRAPKLARLELSRETVQDLTGNEVEAKAGMMQVFKRRSNLCSAVNICGSLYKGCPNPPDYMVHEKRHAADDI